ncbi:DUF4372 domain-containing protein [Paludibaculum fermentans]|uniref:DUF4372 domain-containing protein n=1 Tax=Paludibaculum fermentans TaxID=1473598 RepID=UPI003EBBE3A6
MLQTASLFNQLLHRFPRNEFAALVKKHGAERSANPLDSTPDETGLFSLGQQ